MTWWGFLLWGAFGGVLVEGLDFASLVRHGMWPWERRKSARAVPYLTGLALRVVLGGGLAMGIGLSQQINTPIAAIAIGVATPLIVARLSEAADTQVAGNRL